MSWREPKIEYAPTGRAVPFLASTSGFRLTLEWQTIQRQHADLDLFCLLYDDMARCFEKVNADNPLSADKALQLQTDILKTDSTKSYASEEHVHVDLRALSRRTAAVVVYIDGGSRNFNSLERVMLHCTQENKRESGAMSFMQQLQNDSHRSKLLLFSSMLECRPLDYEGMAACVVYQDGFSEDGGAQWVCLPLFDVSYKVKAKEKQEACTSLLLGVVPMFDKYRPRLFPSVKSICSALSSMALPRLKKSFVASSRGLPLAAFTEELFVQLYDSRPRLLEPAEAAFTVALLQELFGQIDFNGDGFVDWDEFTTFCIHTGLVSDEGTAMSATASLENLNQYSIEYSPNFDIVDTTLKNYLTLYQVRHVPENRRLLVLEEAGHELLVFNDNFERLSSVTPAQLNRVTKERTEQVRIYDVCYIPFKDMYAYTASDHTILIFKEHSSVGGRRLHYTIFNKMFHIKLHMKLCWSERSKILCSVDSENDIYGWELDGTIPIFQLSRHTALITDFIAIDDHQLFVTCSLDKRIVLWSQTTRRVKGVLQGHTRGVRCISYAKDTLLSAGFECEAKTWDLTTKEPALMLRGHRYPIRCAKIMCRSQSFEDADNLRAITVDESGEFRLWNIFVKEKTSDMGYAELLQVFVGQDEAKTAKVSFIFFPFSSRFTCDKYSNIIAASSMLLHLRPEKIKKEFISPSCLVFSDSSAAIVTAVGHKIVKYDVVNGGFHCEFDELNNGDISTCCCDGQHGRRLYVGMVNGEIMVINFSTGQIISKSLVHSKEVTCVTVVMDKDSNHVVFSSSLDGSIKALTEAAGALTVHFTLESAMGDNAPIMLLKPLPRQHLVMGSSGGTLWGVWHVAGVKKILVEKEEEHVSGLEEVDMGTGVVRSGSLAEYSSTIVTIAVCLASRVKIYALDHSTGKLVHSHTLVAPHTLFLSKLITISYPQFNSVNYGATNNPVYLELDHVLVAGSDEGRVVVWNILGIGVEAVEAFYAERPDVLAKVEMRIPNRTQEEVSVLKRCRAEQVKKVRITRRNTMKRMKSFEDSSWPCSPANPAGINQLASASSTPRSIDEAAEASGGGEADDTLKALRSLPHRGTVLRALSTPVPISIPSSSVCQSQLKDSASSVKTLPASLCWQAHTDIIQSLVPLKEHNCFVTMSLDGYIRLWNLQEDCVGELPLPNIADKRKNTPHKEPHVRRPTNWNFVMQRMPVTWQHRSEAASLVKMVSKFQTSQRKHCAAQEYYHRRMQEDLKILRREDSQLSTVSLVDDHDAAAHRRRNVMAELSEPYVSSPLLARGNSFGVATAAGNPIAGDGVDDDFRDLFARQEDGDGDDDSEGGLFYPHERADAGAGLFDQQTSAPHVGEGGGRGGDKTKSKQGGLGSALSMSSFSSSLPMPLSSSGRSGRERSSPARPKTTPLHSQARSLFRAQDTWNNIQDLQANRVAAFSDSSINASHTQGVIDKEAHAILRRLNNDKSRVLVYDRTQPSVHMRNVNKACSMQYPSGQTDTAELSFGAQKNLYKHATTIIRDQARSRPSSVGIAKHNVAIARISNNVSNAGKMLHFVSTVAHSDVVLPPLMPDEDESQSDAAAATPKRVEVLQRSRKQGLRRNASSGLEKYLSRSEHDAKILDKERIANVIQKVTDAVNESTPDWERRHDNKGRVLKRTLTQKKIDRYNNAHDMLLVLERKLKYAMMSAHQGVDSDTLEVRKNLTTRDLLPFYQLADLKNFLEIFNKVDDDYSGDLNVEEWLQFFSAFNKSMTSHQARMMFSKIDEDGDGFLSLRDLIPVIFSRASKEQMTLISKYLEAEVCSRNEFTKKEYVLREELETMFAYYDASDLVGFVSVKKIKDKIRSFQMPDQAHLAIFAMFMGFEDDEMLSLVEFMKLFQPYTLTKQQQKDGQDG